VLGNSLSGKPLHVVCSVNPNVCCWMITAYFPDMEKWEADYKTRKAGK
jgi:hypothetical protein